MKLYTNLADFSPVPCVVATGNFDGVHLGHRVVLSRLRRIADEHRLQTVLCTFHPHPRVVLHGSDVSLLNTLDEKIALIRESGMVDHLLVIPFDLDFATMSAEQFLQDVLLSRLGMRSLVMGANNHIGSGRSGAVSHVKHFSFQMNFSLEVIDFNPAVPPVSSSAIRSALRKGELSRANEWLGYPYGLSGTIISGNRIGRTLGFPTANIRIADELKLIPANGVYAARLVLGDRTLPGMLYIGARYIAGEEDDARHVEVHLFDFDEDIYGKEVDVHLIKFMRPPARFDEVALLQRQLEDDARHVRAVL